MAQGRVTDFFSARKNNSAAQPSKRRKVEISTSNIDISSLIKTNVNPYKNLDQEPQSVDTRKENVFSPLQTRAARKSNAVKLKTPRPTTRSRKTKVDPKQKLLPDVLANSPAPIANEKSTKIADAVTSSWDEHDGPACTPSKSQDSSKVTTKGRKRDRDSVKTNSSKNDATPDKRQPEATKSPQDSKARKKLQLKSKEKVKLVGWIAFDIYSKFGYAYEIKFYIICQSWSWFSRLYSSPVSLHSNNSGLRV